MGDRRNGASLSDRDRMRLATCTDCHGVGIHYHTCTVNTASNLTDAHLRKLWIEAGGDFFGPNIETGSMPESKLLPLLRRLIRQ